jgi:1,4-dihydroxy-2-naphthoate octaprenyltransferase
MRPIRAKERGILGVGFQVIGYGPMSFLLGLLAFEGEFTISRLGYSVLVGLWIETVGFVTDILDIEDDEKQGVRTLAVRLGRSNSITYVIVGSSLIIAIVSTLGVLGEGKFDLVLLWLIAPLVLFHTFLFLMRNRQVHPSLHLYAVILETAFPLIVAKSWVY